MYKQVLVLLPGKEPEIVRLKQQTNFYECNGTDPMGNPGGVSIPIETFSYGENEYLIARLQYDLSDEEIINGIKEVCW
ncbi:hypothetical protein D186_21751 [Citrobacter freundii ATCC 8090 = MTCC 1658 = NBRC 12681]|uniref:hypothetical protein n=1 Tax=Citrobacter TaxID=544 RepID=UPI000299C3F5|nr:MULTISPECIES: hypothetical protein [Citrobacter]EKS54717.1 hypothetical protein D186_21751 [Citrobacter freundii ATCC 8090 = MTCC 1658 = NBRC 12681]EXF29326.1 hypothetical protein V172_17415 [Citrobacter freundii RLS1]MBJ9053553.1 hypothetical protein [Citrobacter freundii]MDM3178626.1 hypothetical protein [Citrobacter sp. Cf108]QIH69518.1 hypothetical protein G4551_13950 [Citrobacter freundii ATCC 8090 = MTCC 1658 = NBRC 12681]